MAKKTKKPKRSVKPHTLYEKSGDGLKRKNKNCPKCGKGVSLAAHKDRLTCGKCGYTEFLGKEKKESPKEEKKEAPKEEKKPEKKEEKK